MKEGIQSEKAQEFIKSLSAEYDKVLEADRIYTKTITKNQHGSSSRGGVSFTIIGDSSGKVYNFRDEEYNSHLDEVEEVHYKNDSLSDLVSYFSPGSKIQFSMEKGKLIQIEKYGVSHLLEDIKQQIEDRRNDDEENPLLKAEVLIHIKEEADDLGLFVDNSEHSKKGIDSYSFVFYSEEIESLHVELGGKLETLYLLYQNGELTAKSNPAFPEHGLEENTVTSIELEAEHAKRKIASDAAIKTRNEFFESIGEVHPETLYLSVGGFRSFDWPENSTSHTSAKLRVIHAEKSTILITDGLSNLYGDESKDKNMDYNGIGVEFYIEYYGKIDFNLVREHFCLALLNAVTQIAINHGDFKKLMLQHKTLTIEFKEDNVELWCVKENHSNHKVSTYFTSKQFKEGSRFGTFLGMESETVPQTLQMNLEEILLINIKPFDKSWLTKTKLGNSDNEVQAKTRLNMIEHFDKTGERNLIPLTYQKEYIDTPPKSDGTVTRSIFPFHLFQ